MFLNFFPLVKSSITTSRYAPDALSTRMYRSFGAMFEGWTKNLARLFGFPLMMAAGRALDLLLMIGLPLLLWAFFPFAAGSLRLSHPLGREFMAILCPGGEIQFLCCRLRHFRICPAAFLSAAGKKLVAAHGAQPGGLERQGLLRRKALKTTAAAYALLHLRLRHQSRKTVNLKTMKRIDLPLHHKHGPWNRYTVM